MKKVLIIGINGFVGAHLSNELINNGYKCYGADLSIDNFSNNNIKLFKIDILNKEMVSDLLKKIEPDYIVNLAAISSVKLSWKIPQKTFEININGTINILESLKELKLKTRVLLIGSSEQYGKIDYSKPINEENELNALNPYGISKATQEKIAKMYVEAYGIDIIMARAFNHIGPGQKKGFVVPDFASQLVEIEKGDLDPVIKVGNLSAERDFTDVRDIVIAYRLLLEKGSSGEIYNVGSGETITVQRLLELLVKNCNCKVVVKTDLEKLRTIETPKIQCDNSKLKNTTGWERKIPVERSLKDIIEYWRNQ